MNQQFNLNIPVFNEIDALVRELKTYHFCTMEEYYNAISSEKMVKKQVMADDLEFVAKNPDNPMSSNYRFDRIRCSDDILRKVRELDTIVPDETLAAIHEILFDCCATVRLSMVEALSIIQSKDSIPYLKKLVETESESSMVKSATAQALEACKNFSMKG